MDPPQSISFCRVRIGPKYVGPIHGRVLLASSAAALAGPSILLSLRSKSETAAIQDLVAKVDPARFQQAFSAGVEETQALIEVTTPPRMSQAMCCSSQCFVMSHRKCLTR